jgi:hypothetical protein
MERCGGVSVRAGGSERGSLTGQTEHLLGRECCGIAKIADKQALGCVHFRGAWPVLRRTSANLVVLHKELVLPQIAPVRMGITVNTRLPRR